MAITLVQSIRNSGQASSSTLTCTLPGAMTVGNLVWAWWSANTAARTFVSATDNAAGGPNTWTKDGTDISNATAGSQGTFSSVITAGGAGAVLITVTLSGTSGTPGDMICGEFASTTGWPALHANFYDTEASGVCASGCTAAAATGTLTAAQTNELVVAGWRSGSSRTVTNDSGFSDIQPSAGTSTTNHTQFKDTTSFNETVDYTMSSAPGFWQMKAAAFKVTVAAGGANRRVIMVS